MHRLQMERSKEKSRTLTIASVAQSQPQFLGLEAQNDLLEILKEPLEIVVGTTTCFTIVIKFNN